MAHPDKRKWTDLADPWVNEAEASVALKPKTKVASYVAILDQQNAELESTYVAMQRKIAALRARVSQTQNDIKAESQRQRQSHRQFNEEISRWMAKHQQQDASLPSIATLHMNDSDHRAVKERDRALDARLDALYAQCAAQLDTDIEHWHSAGNDHIEQLMEELIRNNFLLEQRYYRAHIRLTEQQSKCRELEKNYTKLTETPLGYQSLLSYKQKYIKVIDSHEQLQQRMNITRVQRQWAEIQVRVPFSTIRKTLQSSEYEQPLTNWTKLLHGYLRRRSAQQLLLYGYETVYKRLALYQQVWRAYIEDADTHHRVMASTSTEPPQRAVAASRNDTRLIKQMRDSLTRFISHPQEPFASMSDDRVIEFLLDLCRAEKAWNEGWTKDLDDNIDAVRQLDEIKRAMDALVFGNTANRDKIELKPKEYDEMQWVLERHIEESQIGVDRSVRKFENKETLFKKRANLFSLFMTDPFTFEARVTSSLHN
ncbi:hypothetical protein BC940DRAFT_371493 [Gongronella butleri]|nr:hypothetical protein BC940DRAFT_371493 [Gongronella butleri]